MNKSKKCKRCNVEKDLEKFCIAKYGKLGRSARCKDCAKQQRDLPTEKEKLKIKHAKHYVENRKEIKEKSKEWAKNNEDYIKEYRKTYAANNKEYTKKYQQKYRDDNKEILKEKKKKYYSNNKEKLNKARKIYKENNKEKVLTQIRKYTNKRRLNDSKYRLRKSMSCAIQGGLKAKKLRKGWQTLVPYTLEELKLHLESKFTKGMTWENYGKDGWHIDHIIPQSLFRYDSYNHPAFHACWALSNLQPLWADENLAKRDKIKMTSNIKKFLKSVNQE